MNGSIGRTAAVRSLYQSRTSFSAIVFEVTETLRFKNVISSFVQTSLKQRYRRSVLGFAWSLLAPVMNYGVMAVVFAYTMRASIPNYFLYIFSGAVFYNLLSSAILHSPTVMLTNEGYIKKIYVPKLVFILNVVLIEFVNFLLSFVALIVLGLALGKLTISWSYLFLPIPIFFGLLFVIGVASVVSIMTVFFRDTLHILPIMMQVAFFSTPVLYELSMLPEKVQHLIRLNPFYHFVEAFRAPLYAHALPHLSHMSVVAGLSLIAFFFGLWLLAKLNNKIIFKL